MADGIPSIGYLLAVLAIEHGRVALGINTRGHASTAISAGWLCFLVMATFNFGSSCWHKSIYGYEYA